MKESSLKYHYQNLLEKSTWLMVTHSQDEKSLNTNVQEVGEFFFDGEHYTHRGPLESFQIAVPLLNTSGTMQYRGKSYPFPKAGQMLFIDCSYGEKIDTLGESHILFIHFYGTWVKSYYDIFYEMNGQSPIVPFQSQTVINHIKRIIDIYSKPTAFYEDIVAESLIMECITKLIRSTAPRLSADYSKAVTDCIDMINSEYTGDLSLEKLSEKIHVSKFHLCRLFKKETGITPNEYITKPRISKAKELLQSTDMSQDEICEKTGICNGSYLCKLFLTSEGITPAAYRKKWKS
jgi:AraC-like DNA-binding protein